MKNSSAALIKLPVSSTPAVSYGECIASCGSPISTVFIGTCVFEIFPRVDPPGTSERFTKVWYFTPARSQRSLNFAADTASVQYFWLALYLMTIPPFGSGPVHRICLFYVIWMQCMGIIRRDHKTACQRHQIFFIRSAKAIVDPSKRIF